MHLSLAMTSGALTPSICTASRVRKASRRVSQIYDRELAPYDLTVTQFGLLVQLRAAPGASIGALADSMVMDATTLSRNLRPLERRQLVVAEADKEDGRVRKLKLTPQGRATLDRALNGWRAAQDTIAAALGADEMRALNAALDRALDRLAD
ncbi:MAG: MarR family winged helix-turn-helix transcriptional regulator [Rhodoblastus sp.]